MPSDFRNEGIKSRLLAGRYEIVRPIARGGMGAVYLARQLQLDRKVAVKVLRPDARPSPSLIARFRRESLVAKRLTHPNTVRIYDYGETDDGDVFLVMEYLEGTTLAELLRSRGALPLDVVTYIARQILKSLVEAHTHGIVHRDIKPSNVMLCEQLGEECFVKVLDFGIARFHAGEQEFETQSGAMVGTAHYMSPEQALGRKVDARSDLYSLGVMLFELASGQRPYTGDSPVEVAMQHASSEPVEIVEPLTNTPLGVLIQRATKKAPDDRYATARDMLEDLDQPLRGAGVPIDQSPPKLSEARHAPGDCTPTPTEETLTNGGNAQGHLPTAAETPATSETVPTRRHSPSRAGLPKTGEGSPAVRPTDSARPGPSLKQTDSRGRGRIRALWFWAIPTAAAALAAAVVLRARDDHPEAIESAPPLAPSKTPRGSFGPPRPPRPHQRSPSAIRQLR